MYTYETPHQRFLRTPPKSFFKKLFFGTELGRSLEKMSQAKLIPDGLKTSECERNLNYRPPIPYVPDKDIVQDSVAAKHPADKVKLPGNLEWAVPVWTTGTQEAFLIHVQNSLNAIKKKGLVKRYDLALSKEEEAEAIIETAEAILEGRDSTKNSDEDPPPKMTPREARTAISVQKPLLEKALSQKTEAAKEIFQLYANFLSEESRQPWDKIVEEQTESESWTDVFGKEQEGRAGETYESFLDCVTFHLQTVFANDAAETQARYISTGIKKPNKIPVRHFFQRVEQLNRYLSRLPCLYYSPLKNATTKEVKPFGEAELADILLRTCPRHWQDQYRLTQNGVPPQSLKKLLAVLENIERSALANPQQPSNLKKGDKSNGNSEANGKRKGMKSPTDRIPKKARQDKKHCQLCHEHGGAYTTHNTAECRKYEKDGTFKNKSAKKPSSNGSGSGKGKTNFAQLTERCDKLEKQLKKAKKSISRKKKRYDSSDSDSDSE